MQLCFHWTKWWGLIKQLCFHWTKWWRLIKQLCFHWMGLIKQLSGMG